MTHRPDGYHAGEIYDSIFDALMEEEGLSRAEAERRAGAVFE